MIAYHYLLISSTLDCSVIAPLAAHCMSEGRLSEAAVAALAAGETANDPLKHARLRQVCGDIHLLRGALEDAEEAYRHSLKGLESSPETEALSCRSAGLLAMFQRRFETAASCFHKILGSACTRPARFEAHMLMAGILFESGLRSRARDLLNTVSSEAAAAANFAWQQLALLMLHDFDVRATVQQQTELRDDIYWQSLGTPATPSALMEMPVVSGEVDPAVARLIEQRADQLSRALALARGQASDSLTLQSCLSNTRILSPQCHQTVVLEMTQAALAGKLVHIAEILIVGGGSTALQRNLANADGTDPQQRQLVYCYAKLRLLQGLSDQGLAMYAGYALLAMQSMRSVYPIAQRFDEKPASHYAVVKDDISARLPARYRRAYQYMLAHSHVSTLSINDVANVIGVSERALQLAFKEHIGLSPREVLRRHRMQKIREDLQEATGAGVMEVAMKHGIRNRTALTAGYRRYYNETPSKTTMG
ncbi:helix-turn-helix domain-containing protein [Xylophilus rhododendri]|uniref:Helix-turn-helix domain-containing protein n=1 Tax=Xylophilus rhododendri TaxID=2697032 RepID=A0A857JBA3_9BURK|nr:helix-turn-helix transcriptional regulator [Xylophilus rhododendri]QHI99995.1 helix-turn-helix domain-containing protein [Xylophilus rhododendri]